MRLSADQFQTRCITILLCDMVWLWICKLLQLCCCSCDEKTGRHLLNGLGAVYCGLLIMRVCLVCASCEVDVLCGASLLLHQSLVSANRWRSDSAWLPPPWRGPRPLVLEAHSVVATTLAAAPCWRGCPGIDPRSAPPQWTRPHGAVFGLSM